jgi:antitoxin CptB
MPHDLDTRRKRLRYRASHTGTRETNILFGGFVEQFGGSLAPGELAEAEHLLDANDIDIVNWIMERAVAPPEFDTALMARLRRYATERHGS